MICNAKIYSVSVTLLRRLIVHFRMITQYQYIIIHVCKSLWKLPKCPIAVNDPNVQELDHSRARVNDLQKAQEEQPEEITRISKELESFWVCWYPFGYGALLAALVRAWKNCPYFSNSHSDSCISVRTEKKTKAGRLIFTFWCSWFVSLLQERDEMQRSFPNACSGRKIQGRDVPAR